MWFCVSSDINIIDALRHLIILMKFAWDAAMQLNDNTLQVFAYYFDDVAVQRHCHRIMI